MSDCIMFVSNWGWIAREAATHGWTSAGAFIAALVLRGIAVPPSAAALIVAAFAERRSTVIERSDN